MITKSIFKPIVKSIVQSITEPSGGADVFRLAQLALGFDPTYSEAFAGWYVSQKPAITGVVSDERSGVDSSRAELTNRATTFITNQYFSHSGQLTATSKTKFSAGLWFRTAANNDFVLSEYNPTGDQRSWLVSVSSNKFRIIVSDDGTAASDTAKRYSTPQDVNDDAWHYAIFDIDTTANELRIWLDGRRVADGDITKALDHNLSSIFDATADFNIAAAQGTSPLDGEISTAWFANHKTLDDYDSRTADEVARDLYLGSISPSTAVDFFGGYFRCIGDRCWDQTANANHPTANNSPTLYTDENIPTDPFGLNQYGWTDNAGTIVPRRINTILDAQGNALGHSGQVARRAQLEDGPCLTFSGTEYATDAGLVGTETVVSSGGTSTPSISAGQIDFTVGTCWDLVLSNGSRYPMSEQVGTVVYDVVNSNHLQLVNAPSWATQPSFFWGEHYGYSLYEHASSADMFVPLKTDVTALTITPQTGYTKTDDYPAGAKHNDTQATLKGFVADSDSEAAIYFGASFNGTTSKIDYGDIGNTTEVEFDLYVPNVTGTKALLQLVSGDYIQLNAATLEAVDIAGAAFQVDGVTSTTITAATWQTVKVTYTSKDSTAVILGNQTTSFLTGYVRNLTIKNGATDIVIAPLYKDSLDRSANCNHGTDTAITYLSNPASEIAALNPTITATETLAQTDGNKKLILVGQK